MSRSTTARLVGGSLLVASLLVSCLLIAPTAEASARDDQYLGWVYCANGLTYTYKVGTGYRWTTYDFADEPWGNRHIRFADGYCGGTYCTVTMTIPFQNVYWWKITVMSPDSNTAQVLSWSCL